MSPKIDSTEYLDHASPAVLRAKALDLFRLSREHQTELNLVKDLLTTVGHLNRYADLVERMYLNALETGYGGGAHDHAHRGPSDAGRVVNCPAFKEGYTKTHGPVSLRAPLSEGFTYGKIGCMGCKSPEYAPGGPWTGGPWKGFIPADT